MSNRLTMKLSITSMVCVAIVLVLAIIQLSTCMQGVKSKYLKRFDITITAEELLVIHACLNGKANIKSIPHELVPYLSGIKKEIKKQVLSYKITAHEVQI